MRASGAARIPQGAPQPVVERWFALLTEKQLRHGIHRSTKELEATIGKFIQQQNRNPKPFVWQKTADQILDSVARFCKQTLDPGS
jgi:hypothetical protein